jgi:hypothetical protein
MRRIGRKAVVVDVVAIAALIDGPLPLVAIAAERAQRAETELGVIAAMSRVMVRDGGVTRPCSSHKAHSGWI